MKTFLKLFIAVAAFSCVTAHAASTSEQKAAAIKAVVEAVATGDKEKVKKAVSEQVAQYPELAGEIVAAALQVPGVTPDIQVVIVSTAAFTAPKELAAIILAIRDTPGLSVEITTRLITSATSGAAAGTTATSGGNNVNTPPPVVSQP
ncbi:MAG: hypothetical protein V4727_04195 [Verrucomicrobiota bacterium]